MKDQFIGKKKIKETKVAEQKTPMGNAIVEVDYEDGTKEFIAQCMFDKVVSIEQEDETKLQDKRVNTIVDIILFSLREWGVKIGEIDKITMLLAQSLTYNSNQALLSLVGDYMPKPLTLDEVDLLVIDKILKDKNGSKK
jgi:hypothetical protein